jgi:hypothetical protein
MADSHLSTYSTYSCGCGFMRPSTFICARSAVFAHWTTVLWMGMNIGHAVRSRLPLTDRLKKGGNKVMHAYTCTYNDRSRCSGSTRQGYQAKLEKDKLTSDGA